MASKVQVIGRNAYGEFGIQSNDFNGVLRLKQCPINNKSQNISKIISGNDFGIFYDSEYQNIWSAGYNGTGQCCANHFEHIENQEHQSITYFKENNIKINKICTNTCALTVFWITDSNQVYGNGENENFQLGIGHNKNQNHPVLIPALENMNVIDIQPAAYYTIALCSNSFIDSIPIISFWSRYNGICLPVDIINMIEMFFKLNQVLSTGGGTYKCTGHGQENKGFIKEWTEIEGLKGKHIEKIRVGHQHSLFLESNGTVWCCGSNDDGQCGLGHLDDITGIECIKFFLDRNIKIKEMECGWRFNVMIDYDGRVWVFGANSYGQLGNGQEDGICTPKELEMFRNCCVECIKCGSAHIYLRCDGDKHFLWGDNWYNECLVFDRKVNVVRIPRIIKIKNMVIKDVFVGYDNTKLVVSAVNK